MPKLPRISGSEAVKALGRMGFYLDRQTGSHAVLKKPLVNESEEPCGEVVCVVPLHRELKTGTLAGVLKQAQVNPEEFISNL
ncbi:hypothetical protein BST81_25405 [Leptolyngbya sp. 'hensonii']|uniref:type II toxin-antitoxin system HicA family toxin n=1 Tax=Leptolyngbya sp. 'hensonii' TaxID=1922337 RepID=UPI00094F9E71|nr:type II toxin-antitoxin system HicA family toxin [Leptolyngbya sp. 'hensonii']OLP15613.1 hypothetical protein BST81_25405 [Leptolyngbya sp. 'hensonii']